MAPGTSFLNFNGLTWRVTGTSPAAAYVSGFIADNMDRFKMSGKDAVAATATAFPPIKVGN
jgi:hypothetical protein